MSFHVFHISEAYSNADGTLQFIEFHGEANGQNLWAGHSITVTKAGSPTHTLSITTNLSSSTTLNKHVLVATQAFADLTGITPDYIIPANFLYTTGTQTINFPGMDNLVNVVLPTDGLHSLDENGAVQVASPTNFAGTTVTSASDPLLGDAIEDVFAGNVDPFEFVVPAGTFVDFTNDTLSYAATLPNGDPLPAWLTFTPGTRAFSFAAGTGVVGTIEVKVTASDTLGGSASDTFALTVISGDVVVGTEVSDTLSGTADDDHLTGLGGDDSLAPGAGDDTMLGGLGNDTFAVDSLDDLVTELAGQGTADRVRSSVSIALAADVEQLEFIGVGNLEGLGNGLANLMIGNDGNNELDGAGGADSMQGGLGNDTYSVELGDSVVEGVDPGDDLVLTSAQLGALFANVERLTLLGAGDIDATGNAGQNTLTGNTGNNVLNGGTGADAMAGGGGNDTYHVDDAGDTVSESGAGADQVLSAVSFTLMVGGGDDVLAGDVENLFLTGVDSISGVGNALANVIGGNENANQLGGGDGDDRLFGNGGADTLEGGAGDDTLKGGSGADAFLFEQIAGTDRLSDFTSGVDEIRIDNEAFTAFAIEGALAAENAQLGLASAISDTSGDANDFLKYATDTGQLYYDANGSAAGGFTQIALLVPGCGPGVPALDPAGDIVVI